MYAKNYYRVKSYLTHFVGKKLFEYPFIRAFGVDVPYNMLGQLARLNSVDYITSHTKVFSQINVAKEISKISELNKKGYLGEGIGIAIIDTGVKNHLDFVIPKNRIVAFKDFINKKEVPYDDNGHGTFITGLASGSGLISGGKYAGVAPKSSIISLKTLNANGETGAFNILGAMQWVYDNAEKYNIKIACMSFGSTPLGNGDPLTAGAEALWNKGIIVVAAAGNSGPDEKSIKSPGVSSKIITVGAMDDNRKSDDSFDEKLFTVADFSSRGPAFSNYKPDVLAPGVNIVSTCNKKGKFYSKLSGTSVATPIVAGLACLIVEKYPSITPNEVKSLLFKSARSIVNNRNAEGFGFIDASNILLI